MAPDAEAGTAKDGGTAQSSGSGTPSRQGSRKRSSGSKRSKSTSSRSSSSSAKSIHKRHVSHKDVAQENQGVNNATQNHEGVAGSNWPGNSYAGDTEPLLGHFATIVGGFECEVQEPVESGETDENGKVKTQAAKHNLDGLYGVVTHIVKWGEYGEPLEARFDIRTRPALGVYLPPTGGDGTITVPWNNLRRAAAGLR